MTVYDHYVIYKMIKRGNLLYQAYLTIYMVLIQKPQ